MRQYDSQSTESNESDGRDDNRPPSQASSGENREPARIITDREGNPVGTAIWMSAEQLRRLGLRPGSITGVTPRVMKGAVLLEPVE